MSKKVVIIGAGYAGILTAKKLAKQVKKTKADVHITIIDRNPFHTMLTELHEVAAGRVDEDSITISLEKVFAKREVNVVLDEITAVDYAKKEVKGVSGSYPYDYLVMAAGSKPTFFGVVGAEEYAHKLWSYQDAVKLREHILERFRQARVCLDPVERRRLLTFCVIGAGFTGVEMVGELAEWVPFLCEKFEIPRSEVTITNLDILDRVVPTLTPASSAKVQRRMEKMGIDVRLGAGVCSIGPDYVDVRKEDGSCVRRSTGTVIWAAGIEASDITAQAGQVLENAGRGRIKTDAFLRSLSNPAVYVAGDNLFFIPEGHKAPLPQMVEVAEHASAAVAHNLMVDLLEGSGNTKFKSYKPVGTANHGVMVCVGGRWGAAEVGTDKRKFKLCSFFAMFSKHLINLVYFVQVLGWNKIMSYLRHEFFTIRNCRSFVGGHFSNRTPSFLLLFLRLWLGAVWVYEGVMKIVEGWFEKNMLANFFAGANAWYASLMSVGGGGGATDAASAATQSAATTLANSVADAVSSASQAVTAVADAASSASQAGGAAVQGATQAAGEMLINWNFWLFRILFAVGKAPAHAKLGDYAFKIDVPLMNWFLEKFVLPSDGFSMFMQIFIVIAEILVGLALMGGFLTTPAAAASLVLQAMFLMTTGLYLNNIWMIFASIAMLFGAGKVFGLDYYAQPLMKRGWKKIGFVKKWYLYHD